MSLAISSAAIAQQSPVNHSIDPAWLFVPERIAGSEFVVTESVMGSDIPVQYRFVELLDGVYAPIGVRTPEGDGPFPTVVFAHMNGGFGLRWVREWTNYGSGTLEQFLDAGYAVVWMRYRAEVDTLYGDELTVREFQGRQRYSRGPLEYEDAIAIVEYVKGLTGSRLRPGRLAGRQSRWRDVDEDRIRVWRSSRRRCCGAGVHGLPGVTPSRSECAAD